MPRINDNKNTHRHVHNINTGLLIDQEMQSYQDEMMDWPQTTAIDTTHCVQSATLDDQHRHTTGHGVTADVCERNNVKQQPVHKTWIHSALIVVKAFKAELCQTNS